MRVCRYCGVELGERKKLFCCTKHALRFHCLKKIREAFRLNKVERKIWDELHGVGKK